MHKAQCIKNWKHLVLWEKLLFVDNHRHKFDTFPSMHVAQMQVLLQLSQMKPPSNFSAPSCSRIQAHGESSKPSITVQSMDSKANTTSSAERDQQVPAQESENGADTYELSMSKLSIDPDARRAILEAGKLRPGPERRSRTCGVTKPRAPPRRESPL